MSHIVEFTIAGLAGRKDVYSKRLNRHVNVFFGLNGSGKTSLLRILDSAMSGDATTLKMVPFESAEVTIHSIEYRRDFVRTISRTNNKNKPPSRRKKPSKQTGRVASEMEESLYRQLTLFEAAKDVKWKTKPLKPDTSKTDWRHIYLPTWRLNVSEEPYSVALHRKASEIVEREIDWDIFFARRLHMLWSNYSNKLLSKVQEIQGEGLTNILQGILATSRPRTSPKQLDPKKAYRHVTGFFARQGIKTPKSLGSARAFERRYSEDAQLRRIVDHINRVELQIEKAKTSRNKLEQLILNMFTGNKSVVFTDPEIMVETDEQRDIGLASLSSGEKHVLWIFIEALLAEGNTLLIDEPEMSLHLDWEKSLISDIQQLNPNVQLILATHSVEIMADVADSNIFRL